MWIGLTPILDCHNYYGIRKQDYTHFNHTACRPSITATTYVLISIAILVKNFHLLHHGTFTRLFTTYDKKIIVSVNFTDYRGGDARKERKQKVPVSSRPLATGIAEARYPPQTVTGTETWPARSGNPGDSGLYLPHWPHEWPLTTSYNRLTAWAHQIKGRK